MMTDSLRDKELLVALRRDQYQLAKQIEDSRQKIRQSQELIRQLDKLLALQDECWRRLK